MPKLSTEQVDEAQEAFNLYDRDGDGKIKIEELGTVMRACGRNPTNAEVKSFEEQADANGTGMVDFKTFIKVMENNKCKADDIEEVKDCFRIFDKDNTGFVPVTELRHVLTTLGEKLSTDEVDDLLRDAEIDENGNINYATFVASLMPKKQY